jgi:hypothetical protein
MKKLTNKVNLEFLYEVVELRGFNPTFICFIKQITQGGYVGVKVNDIEDDFSLTGKGLRQGPHCPSLIQLCY